MARRNKFRVGRHLVTDERTGIVHYDDEIVRDWDGLHVKRGTEDGKHPQWYVRALGDPYPVANIRPELGTDFETVCGYYRMEFFPRSSRRRALSATDDLLPLPGIGQMAIGPLADECGYLFHIQEPTEFLNAAVIEASETSFSAPDTTHIVNLPDGIVTASRVIICVTSEDVVTFTWPAGWTVLFSDTNSTVSLDIYYRDIDGTEGFTGTDDVITVTTDLVKATAHIVHILGNYDTATAPQVSTGVTGNSSIPDPDRIAPTFGSQDFLSIAVEAHNTGSTTAVKPVGYSNQVDSKTN